MKNFLTTALLASAGLVLAGQANAATTSKTATADFKVKIEVLSTCAINATDIDFGSVNSAVAANDKTGTFGFDKNISGVTNIDIVFKTNIIYIFLITTIANLI